MSISSGDVRTAVIVRSGLFATWIACPTSKSAIVSSGMTAIVVPEPAPSVTPVRT